MTRLQAAIEGRLDEYVDAEINGAGIAVTKSAKTVAPRMQREVRSGIAAALGDKVARSWKFKIYPPSGNSTATAVFQYDSSKRDWVIRAVTESGPITARNSRWIAVPTEAALLVLNKRFHHNRSNRGRGASAGSAVEAIEKRFGDLQFVYLKGQNKAYLVAEVRGTSRRLKDGSRKRGYGKARRSKKTGKVGANVQTVVMFVLLPSVRRASRRAVNLERLADKYNREFAQLIVENWPDLLR